MEEPLQAVLATGTEPARLASTPGLRSCGPPGATPSNYDVTADGKRFVMIEDKDQDAVAKQINVVLNFGDELKRGPRPARF